MKKIFFLLTAFLFLIARGIACGNFFYALDKEGNLVPMGYSWKFPFNKDFNLELNVTKLKKLKAKLEKEKNYMLLSDYSLCLMKLGKPKEALDILIELYKHYPNEYKIAANLGTAYEINGQNDSALKYIKRDMQLNPNDHEGSEWVHVKILETKLALKKDPTYLTNHTVLQLTPAQKKDSIVLQHISIQLQERVPFTPVTLAPDELMASLFVDLADISASIKSIEYARAYYQIAKKYYNSQLPFLDAKIKEMERLMNKYSTIELKQDYKHFEGQRVKVGYFNYKELLSENNPTNYKVNWDKINTDVNSLLALVDFTKTTQAIKDSLVAQSKEQVGDLKLIPDDDSIVKKDSAIKPTSLKADETTDIKKQTSWANSFIWVYLLGAVFVVGLGYFIFSRFKKNKRS
ncbi:MAG TPA: tetratricopeptide repeat protein [Bacteroidia bacterium]|nr:tetratricopeptide repeat protein [Bacteroidia bacterium]